MCALCADDESHVGRHQMKRDEYCRHLRVADTDRSDRVRYPDDFNVQIWLTELEMLPERVARSKCGGELLTHDRDVPTAGKVRIGEVAPSHQARSHDVKVAREDGLDHS